jgi:hypothetical protein
VSTRRPKRSSVAASRQWPALHSSIGEDGRMESEALYMAVRALAAGDDIVEEILTAHYGTLEAAETALKSLDHQVAPFFAQVAQWLADEDLVWPLCRCEDDHDDHEFGAGCSKCDCWVYRPEPIEDDDE